MKKLILLTILLAGIAGLLNAQTTYTVNSTADTNTGSGTDGTLRYVLTAINTAATGNNTIDMTGITGTITLTSQLPPINYGMIINGPGAATLTVSNPTNGAEVYAQVFVPGKCILPQNLITSSKIALNINPKPATPTITLSWDTLYASNVGAGTYTWYRNGTAVGTGNIKKLTQHGGYRCVLTNNGCGSDSSNLVTFNSLAVDEISAKNARLYPVPAGQYLYLELHAPISEVSIYNAAGQQVITGWKQKSTQWNQNSQTETVQMDLGGLAAGSYVLKYTVQGASMQQAFIKE